MSDPRDYKLDIAGLGESPQGGTTGDSPVTPRPWLSVLFECCNVYQRVYRVADGSAYEGRCPRCAGQVRFVVGAGGTSARSFRVS